MTAAVRALARGEASAWTYGGSCTPTHDGIRAVHRARAAARPRRSAAARGRTVNEIPLGAGLGSSAAAYALGAAIGERHRGAARRRTERTERLARVVVELEGHPDNALAACLGGAVVVAHGDDGLSYARFPPPDVSAVVVVPEIVLADRRGARADARVVQPRRRRAQRAARRAARRRAGRRPRSTCCAPRCVTGSISRTAPVRSRAWKRCSPSRIPR